MNAANGTSRYLPIFSSFVLEFRPFGSLPLRDNLAPDFRQ